VHRPKLQRALLAVLALLVLAPRPLGDQPIRNRRGLRGAKAGKLSLGRRQPRVAVSAPVLASAASSAALVGVAPKASAPAPSVSTLVPVAASAIPAPNPSASAVGSASEVPLVVDAYEDPLVLVPPTADGTKAPVVIAVHGVQSMPESVCDPLRETLGTRAFVLCPAGIAVGFENGEKLYQFGSAAKLWDEIEAGLDALRVHYGDEVDTDKPLYVGFSQGSILGVDVVIDEAKLPYSVFVEGGHDAWSKGRIETLEKEGGRRVLFVTGSEYWVTRARTAVPLFSGTKVEVKHLHLEGLGHHFTAEVAKAIDAQVDWLVDGDPRW